jgi:hypothetical protein
MEISKNLRIVLLQPWNETFSMEGMFAGHVHCLTSFADIILQSFSHARIQKMS